MPSAELLRNQNRSSNEN